MRRRLLLSTALIAVAAVVVLGVPLGVLEAHRVRTDAATQLEHEADAVAAAVDDRLEANRPVDTARLRTLVGRSHQVIVITSKGRRIVVGPPVRGAATTVAAGATERVRVVASAPASEVSRRVLDGWLLVAALALAGTAAALLLGFAQGRRLARPLERLAATSRRLADGDFSARAGRSAIPEIDAVAAAFDGAAVRIAGLVGREREFSANVSHQLRTPLTALRLRLEELLHVEDPALVALEAQAALDEADRLQATITQLLAAARSGRAGEARRVALAPLARTHVASWRPVFDRAGRRLALEVHDAAVAFASPGAVGQALDVLVENALEHGAGSVVVGVGRRDGDPAVAVGDEGGAIPVADTGHIFDRGRSLAGGSGVGLHLARALVEADGGRLTLTGMRPTEFEIRLRDAQEVESGAAEDSAPGPDPDREALPNL